MLNRVKCFLLCSLLFGVFVPLGFTAPSLKIEPPAKKVSPGKRVVLKVQLEWPRSEGLYSLHVPDLKLENLTLEDQNQFQETGKIVSQTFLYKFRPIGTGPAVIYPFEISCHKVETGVSIPMLVPEQRIEVVSNIPFKIAVIGCSILVGFSVALFVGLKQWELWKIRTAAKNAPKVDPKQRIYVQAKESIGNFSSPHPKEKLTHWSNQLRIVVVTYYDVSGIAAPADILAFLKVKGIPAGDWNEISRIFGQLTEMQFSRHDISEYDLARMQRTLLQYVTGKIIINASNP